MKLETPRCPTCHTLADAVLERFVLDGSADLTVEPDGHVEWGGDTNVPWDGQRSIVNSEGQLAIGCPADHWWWSTVVDLNGTTTHIDDDAIDDPRDRLVRCAYKHFQAHVGGTSIKVLAYDAGLRWSRRRRAWFGRPSQLRMLQAALTAAPQVEASWTILRCIEQALRA